MNIPSYDRAVFRVSENYLLPDQEVGGVSRAEFERQLAASGVDARWIGVYDHGGPRFASRFLPLSAKVPGDLTDSLKRWADTVRSTGMNVISWCSPPHCESAWNAHLEWRCLDLAGEAFPAACCYNSAYGDAFIGMVLETFAKFDLDGLWFDGAASTSLPTRELPGCACPACRAKFAAATGLALPRKVDFADSAFRAWVRWRFTAYATYLKKLVDTVHAEYPGKVLTINHYHRYSGRAWHTACPLDRFACDIITGSEAMQDMVHASVSAKLAGAYGRSAAEIWTPLARWRMGEEWQFHEPAALLHHAAACMTNGAFPSFGFETGVPGGSLPSHVRDSLRPLAAFLRARAPYIGTASANPVALHISQQTETFFFGRHTQPRSFGWYWESAMGWEQLLQEVGAGTDFIFDSHLGELASLRRYGAVILPLSLALSETQATVLREYVAGGGVLLLGPWAGRLDADGEARPGQGTLAELRGVEEGALPAVDNFARSTVYLRNARNGEAEMHGFAVQTMRADHTAKPAAEALFTSGADGDAAITRHRVGGGTVIDFSADLGASFYYAPSSRLRRVVRNLLDEANALPIAISAPASVAGAVRRTAGGQLLVHLHNCPATVHHQGYQSGEDYMPIIPRDVIPVCDVRIHLRGVPVTAATRLVERPGPLAVERRGDCVILCLHRLDLHEIVQIET